MRRLVFAVIVLATGSVAWGYPKPSTVPLKWELKISFQDIKRIKTTLPGEGTQTYWYVVYTVTNTTGRDVEFNPEFTLVTDDLEVIPARVNVAPEVFKLIKREYRNTYPYLEHPRKLIGTLRQGKDNARDSVAVWRDFDPRSANFSVYIAGLSGELISVPNPQFVPGKSSVEETPKQFVLRKTLQIRYCLPTDPARREQTLPVRSGKPAIDWVMR